MTGEKTLTRMFVSKILNNQIDYFNNQLSGIELDGSPEFIHHTRVMSRRLRNTIEVFSEFIGEKTSKKWLIALKKITKSLTKIRDFDVQILFLENEIKKTENQNQIQGINRILLRKKQKKSSLDVKTIKNIEVFNKTGVMSEIRNFVENNLYIADEFFPTTMLSDIAVDTVEFHLKNCFSYVPFITNPANVKELHRLRIAIKNLRYSVELFQEIYPSLNEFLAILKLFQDELGKIHDCDIWLDDLENFRNNELDRIIKFYGQAGPFNFIKPGIDFLEEEITKTRKITFEVFLNDWNENFQNLFWSHLRDQFTEFPAFQKVKELSSNHSD